MFTARYGLGLYTLFSLVLGFKAGRRAYPIYSFILLMFAISALLHQEMTNRNGGGPLWNTANCWSPLIFIKHKMHTIF